MDEATHHLASPNFKKRRPTREDEDLEDDGGGKAAAVPSAGGTNKSSKAAKGKSTKKERKQTKRAISPANSAATICANECTLEQVTDNSKLMGIRSRPDLIVKMAQHKAHIVKEMEQEAVIYKRLSMQPLQQTKIAPRFHGHSKHFGVPIICLDREGPSFDEIVRLGKIDEDLKKSALAAVQSLSKAGVIHGDLALRNMVQSKNDAKTALLIDFGRSYFSENLAELNKQCSVARTLLAFETPATRQPTIRENSHVIQ